jgi:hypothetical protein
MSRRIANAIVLQAPWRETQMSGPIPTVTGHAYGLGIIGQETVAGGAPTVPIQTVGLAWQALLNGRLAQPKRQVWPDRPREPKKGDFPQRIRETAQQYRRIEPLSSTYLSSHHGHYGAFQSNWGRWWIGKGMVCRRPVFGD